MKRTNGFLNIELKSNNKITPIKEFKNIFWIDDKILFKEADISTIYNELIIEEIAKLFNIETPIYDIAIINDNLGNISYNYKKRSYTYIDGTTLLTNYNKSNHTSKETIHNMNNLETIWNALDYHFRNYLDKEQIVEKIMNKLVKYYLLDILTGQIDRSSYNYEIMYNTKEGDLAPYYDNTNSFIFSCSNNRLNPSRHHKTYYESLNEFLTLSSKEYQDLFIEMYNTLTPSKLLEIFTIVERKIQSTIPENIKNKIWINYCAHYIKLESIINQRQEKK